MQQVDAFSEPERWRFDWEQHYTKDQWLDQVPAFGGHSQFPQAKLDELLAGLGAAIDATGGSFTMRCDPEIRVPQLPLDNYKRYSLVSHLDRVGMTKLVRREASPNPGHLGGVLELLSCR